MIFFRCSLEIVLRQQEPDPDQESHQGRRKIGRPKSQKLGNVPV